MITWIYILSKILICLRDVRLLQISLDKKFREISFFLFLSCTSVSRYIEMIKIRLDKNNLKISPLKNGNFDYFSIYQKIEQSFVRKNSHCCCLY